MPSVRNKTPHSLADSTQSKLDELKTILQHLNSIVIAVSGGIDSTLLAVIAGRMRDLDMQVFHAVSPAVPPSATQRVRQYAESENWNLTISDAGEFRDNQYISNPVDRCFYCKTNLYSHVALKFTNQIVSGTNLDDLSDYRPGLSAAEEHSVRHPYVDARITKSDIRSIAKSLSLVDLAELPASPCLSSRVQTGTPINATWLHAIDRVEIAIRNRLKAQVVRCRVRNNAIVIELDQAALSGINSEARAQITDWVNAYFPEEVDTRSVSFTQYKMGSAFGPVIN